MRRGSGRRNDNVLDLDFLLGYCAAITSIGYVDSDGVEKVMTPHQLAERLDAWAVAAPRHDTDGTVVGGRITDGWNVTDTGAEQ